MTAPANLLHDSLIFPISDALQVSLGIGQKGFHGSNTRSVNLGPWVMPVALTVASCLFTPELVTAQVHIKKDLWLYVLCDKGGHRLRAVMFDGPLAGLKSKSDSLGKDAATINKALKPAIRAHLKFDHANDRWSTTDAFDLD